MGYGAQEFGKVLCGPFSGEKSEYVSESIASNHWKVRQKNSSFCVEIEVSEQPDRELVLSRGGQEFQDECGRLAIAYDMANGEVLDEDAKPKLLKSK